MKNRKLVLEMSENLSHKGEVETYFLGLLVNHTYLISSKTTKSFL
jgi:hypothetical protein